jgi:peptidyl-prolyl cis-trans isomerase D
MAIITKLRNSGWVIIVVIVALVLFVVSDLLNSAGKASGPADNTVAIMNGNRISIDEFNEINSRNERNYLQNTGEKELTDQTRDYIRNATWTQLIEMYVTVAEYKKAGFTIGDEEWADLLMGKEPHSLVKQYFSDEKGVFSPANVRNFLSNQYQNSPMAQEFFNNLKKQIESEVLKERYLDYMTKCRMYSTPFLRQDYLNSNRTIRGKVVTLSLNTIQDKDVKVTDADLEKYLKEHREEFKQEEMRDMDFVVWDILPTKADTLENLRAANTVADNYRAYLPDTGDSRTDRTWKKPSDLPASIAARVIPAPIGEVVGPLYGDGAYYVYVKVDEKPDSAKHYHLAHIQVSPDGALINDSNAARSKAQQLLLQATAGEDFGVLAKQNSSDYNTSYENGVMGWKSQEELENLYTADFVKAADRNRAGSVYMTRGRNGAWHVVKVLSDPSARLFQFASVKQEIMPGRRTVDSISAISQAFRGGLDESDAKSFEKQIEKFNLTPRVVGELKPGDRGLPGAENASEAVRWAFDADTKEGSISPVFNVGNRQLVAKMNTVKKEGYAELRYIRSRIEPLVKNQKKGEMIRDKMVEAQKTAKTMEELALKLQTVSQPIEDQNFSTGNMPFVGADFRIIGVAFGLKEGVMSKPIIGTTGVSVVLIEKDNKVEAPKTGLDSRRMMLELQNSKQQAETSLADAMRKVAGIKDFRYKFF